MPTSPSSTSEVSGEPYHTLDPIYEGLLAEYLDFREKNSATPTELIDPRYLDAIKDGVSFLLDHHFDRIMDPMMVAAVGATVGSRLYIENPAVREELGLVETDSTSRDIDSAFEAGIVGKWVAQAPPGVKSRLLGATQPWLMYGEDILGTSINDLFVKAIMTQLPKEYVPRALATTIHAQASEILRTRKGVPDTQYGHFEPDKYRSFLGESPESTHPILARQEADEWSVIEQIEDLDQRMVIDLGAGEGRITRPLTNRAKHIIAIENNQSMLAALQEGVKDDNNVTTMSGDITDLGEILGDMELDSPVQLLLQNTLGTIDGNPKKLLEGMKQLFEEKGGDIVITVFRSETLHEWGLELYQRLEPMVGNIDPLNSGHDGLFVSQTGYISKWRNEAEIQELVKFFSGKGVITQPLITEEYVVLHFKKRD